MTALFARIDLARLFSDVGTDLLSSLATASVVLAAGMVVEWCVPHARPSSRSHASFNIRYALVLLALLAGFRPLLLGVPLALTRALGAGWISFPEGIAGSCIAFISVLIMTDLLEYLFHRAQHRFSFMWKMHELHHSAEHYNVTLSYRHFWAEPLLKAALMYPLVGIVFRVPAGAAMAVGVVFLINHTVAHMNLRFAPRHVRLLVSHPQYHRFHHSRHERDYNKNFCDLLPVWDLLFGTLHRLSDDEFVDVGLLSGAAPASLLEALLWPWRSLGNSGRSQSA